MEIAKHRLNIKLESNKKTPRFKRGFNFVSERERLIKERG